MRRETGIWREMGARCARRRALKAEAMVYVVPERWVGEWRVDSRHSMRAGRRAVAETPVLELRSVIRNALPF